MNYLIFLCILIISVITLYLAKKLMGKIGLIIVFIASSVLSLVLSFKYITLSTITANANSITYVTMFTSLYLLLETVNKKEVKKITNLNFILNIFSSILLYIMSYHVQSLTDSISINMKNVFIVNSKILIIYPITTLVSNYLLIWMYKKIRNLYEVPFITTVTTYLFIGLVESIMLYISVYYQSLDTKIIIRLLLSNYMIKLIITIIYSILLTLWTRKKVNKWIRWVY